MAGQSTSSNFHNRGRSGFGNGIYAGTRGTGSANHVDLGRGSTYGSVEDGPNTTMGDLTGSTFYGQDAVDILRSFGSIWIPGPEGTIDSNGNAVLFSGHWEKNSSSGLASEKSYYPHFKDLIKYERYLVSGISKFHSSEYSNILRGGSNIAADNSCVTGLKMFGSALSIVNIGIEISEYNNNKISGLELSVDTFVAGAVIVSTYAAFGTVAILGGVTVGTAVVAAAIVYSVGKVVYEKYTGESLFDKP